jgi:hypothetical protein
MWREQQGVLRPAIDRLDAHFAAALANHAQDAVGALAQALDEASFRAVCSGGEADEDAVA